MQSDALFEFGAECLSVAGMTAAWRRAKDIENVNRWSPMVVLQICSTVNDGVFLPAASVTVRGEKELRALRAVINEALREEA